MYRRCFGRRFPIHWAIMHMHLMTSAMAVRCCFLFPELTCCRRGQNCKEILCLLWSFVRSLLQSGVQPTLDPTAETLCWSNVLAHGEDGNWLVCVVCVCATCRVKEGLSMSEQLVGYFYSAPLLGMTYCLAKPWLALLQRQPPDWHLFSASQRTLPHLFALAHVSASNTLTLLLKASATVTVYRGHCRTLFFLTGINSLFIMCIGISRNNSLVGGRTRAEVRTPATERYCTRRQSALPTRPHGQFAYCGQFVVIFGDLNLVNTARPCCGLSCECTFHDFVCLIVTLIIC